MDVRGVSYAVEDGGEDGVRRDLRAIRDDLHCTTVMLLGTDVEAQERAAEYALETGLDVYIRPYLADRPRAALLEHLDRFACMAERLRVTYPDRVTLLLGSEFSLTSRGMIPGRWIFLRLQVLFRPRLRRMFDRRITRKLRRVLAEALRTARSRFGGPITYASGSWETVDWSGFDLVGVNRYRMGTDPDGYERTLRALVADSDKPVVITEFGCGAFIGAERRGPSSFRIVNWFAEPPRVREGHTRDEATQAEYVTELIDLFADAGVHGCFVYTFFSPGFPHSADPRHDLDMAGFGLVKTAPEDPASWEPKQAFRAVADRFGSLASRTEPRPGGLDE